MRINLNEMNYMSTIDYMCKSDTKDEFTSLLGLYPSKLIHAGQCRKSGPHPALLPTGLARTGVRPLTIAETTSPLAIDDKRRWSIYPNSYRKL